MQNMFDHNLKNSNLMGPKKKKSKNIMSRSFCVFHFQVKGLKAEKP